MTTSLVLTVNTDRVSLDAYQKTNGDAQGECNELASLFKALACGAFNGSVAVQKASVAAVAASGTYTITYAKLDANDTVTVAGITLTCVTGTPNTVQFKKETDATVTAANLAAKINALATVNIYVTATSALGVVTVTANQAGVVGNLITTAKNSADADGIAVSAAALAGGAGGALTGATVYHRGL